MSLRARALRASLLVLSLLSGCVHSAQRSSAPRGAVHVVARGESAGAIARRYGVSLDALVAENRLADPSKIYPGQRLKIPAGGRVTAARQSGRSQAVRSPIARQPPAPPPPMAPQKEIPVAARCSEAERAPSAFPRSERGFIWPVDGVVVGRYGSKEGLPQRGLDIGAPVGTPVWAVADGEVLFAGTQPGYGQLVVIQHDRGLATVYGRNAENCLKAGARVRRGQVVARLGRGDRAGSPYLYFEIRKGAVPVNPKNFLP